MRKAICFGAFALLLVFMIQSAGGANKVSWAIAIHGGAGTIPRDMDPKIVQGYRDVLTEALKIGQSVLSSGGTSLDAVEKVLRFLENDPRFNAGKGAVYTHQGTHELDSAIMDGKTLNCGSVTGIKTVKHPITLARLVMERSRHVFLMGAGAEAFADRVGVERVDNHYFDTEYRYKQWQKALQKDKEPGEKPRELGTVGCAALDTHGSLAAGTSTGGLTDKQFGRIGDSPIIGAGTYASNASCAISCTGFGEQFIRHTVSHDIAALVQYKGLSLNEAANLVIHKKLNPGDGGIIGVSKSGEIALVYSSDGMFRAAADSSGLHLVAIWEK